MYVVYLYHHKYTKLKEDPSREILEMAAHADWADLGSHCWTSVAGDSTTRT